MAQELPVVDSNWQSQRLKILVIAFFFCGIFLLAFGGGLFLFRSTEETPDIQIVSPASSQSAEIIVHVDGEVKNPGVYKLAWDSRISDAILAAGGLRPEADNSRINLAAKVADGQKVYIAKIGELVSQSIGGSAGQITGQSEGQIININTAPQKKQEDLPAIGPA